MSHLFTSDKLYLAPMAGVSDKAMREICLDAGADITYTEMISAKGLHYANEKTQKMLHRAQNEKHIAVQIFGHESDIMRDQALWIEETLGDRLAYIDINMGCPVRKIAGKGDGAALMKDVDLASALFLRSAGP